MSRVSESNFLTASIVSIYVVLTGFVVINVAISFALLLLFGFFLISYAYQNRLTSVIFWFPIIISAVQNLMLGLFIDSFTEINLKLFLTYNYLVIIFFLVLIFLNSLVNGRIKHLLVLLMAIVLYGLFLMALNGGFLVAVFASLRNITSIFIFTIVGWKLFELKGTTNYSLGFNQNILFALVTLVCFFGIFEQFINNDTWRFFNLEKLWLKKGLSVMSHGFPGNFYASEKWDGNYIRRMVSVYADPVNLGTNLFFFFMLCWFFKNRILTAIVFLCILLTISKGAVLGLLCFALFFFRWRFGRLAYFLTVPVGVFSGFFFLYWAFINNAASVFLHISGFYNSIVSLGTSPLGLGLGNVGVLANRFGESQNSEIVESGLGLIIGQLGIPGMLSFLALFFFMFKKGFRPYLSISREQVLFRTLFVSIILNITFNEVALSPNSCAGYMMILGYLSNKIHQQKLLLTND